MAGARSLAPGRIRYQSSPRDVFPVILRFQRTAKRVQPQKPPEQSPAYAETGPIASFGEYIKPMMFGNSPYVQELGDFQVRL
ncbi:hypothetical protein EVAR_102767_1 [Eumeta japonica]|uniref:Uncharacterized protein n=1 Tax=Eumeta variegata TaxID=151549 RepID=A0A4C1TL99_EUMVA|nr:hypothetical protein EVAR_102767_1 [Eumeta japonica]